MGKFKLIATNIIICCLIVGCTNPRHNEDCDNSITNWQHFILKDSVQVMVTRLKTIKEEGQIDTSMIAQSYYFGTAKEMMRNMMLSDSCEGMRVYYGLTYNNKLIPIVCGVNKDGGDIYWEREIESKQTGTGNKRAVFEVGLCDMSTEEPPVVTTGNYIYP